MRSPALDCLNGTSQASQALAPSPWAIALLLATLFLALTPGRIPGTIDGELAYWVTVALAERGHPTIQTSPDPHLPAIVEHGFLQPGRDGLWFVRYSLGQPLAALPFYLIGRILGGPDSPTTRLFVNALSAVAMAGAGALLYAWARSLWDGRTALLALAIFVLATPAPVYARLFFSEALLTFCLLMGFWLFFTRQPAQIALGGLAIGWAVLTREGAAAALPAAALALLVLARDRRERLAFAGYGMLGAALPISLLLWYNVYRFGHPLRHGYEGEGFTASLLEGVAGLLFSPGRGLLFYAPTVLLALPGARLLWRRDRALVLTAGMLFAGYLLMYGRWWAWHGGWAWGPRFLVPTLPFLLLLAGEAMTQPAGRRAALALGLLGFLAQLPGVFTDHQKFHAELFVERGLPDVPNVWFRPELSPILGQWRDLWHGRHGALALHRLEAQGIPSPIAWGFRLGIAALLAFGLWGLRRPVPPAPGFRLPARWASAIPILLLFAGIALNGVALARWAWIRRQPFCDGAGRLCLKQRFGGQVELVAFSVESPQARPGEDIGLTLWFRALRPITEPLSVYVHVLPADHPEAHQVFQEDHEHPASLPLPRWRPGQLYSDFYRLQVPAALSPGRYALKVGLYRRAPPGGRIPVDGSGADGVILPLPIEIRP
jgi:4-amino-4-deoxy-L-arabinose transferase-like glycosyltransferase